MPVAQLAAEAERDVGAAPRASQTAASQCRPLPTVCSEKATGMLEISFICLRNIMNKFKSIMKSFQLKISLEIYVCRNQSLEINDI